MTDRLPDGRPWFAVPRSPLARPTTKRVVVAGLWSGVTLGAFDHWDSHHSWPTSFGLAALWTLCYFVLVAFFRRRTTSRRRR